MIRTKRYFKDNYEYEITSKDNYKYEITSMKDANKTLYKINTTT